MPDPWGPADSHRPAIPSIRRFGEESYGQDLSFSVRLTSGCRRIRQSETIGKSVDAEADTYYRLVCNGPAPGPWADRAALGNG